MWTFITNTYLSIGVKTILCAIILPLILKFLISKFRRDDRLIKFAAQFPGPNTLPVVGNILEFSFSDGCIEKIINYGEKYGSKFRLWLGSDLVIVLHDLEDIEDIAKNSKLVSKSGIFDAAREFFGDGLLTISKTHWKFVRGRVQPLFARNMRQHTPLINKTICKYVEYMKKFTDGGAFDLWSVLPCLNFDLITGVLFHVEISEQDKSKIQFHDSIKRASEIVIEKMFKPWQRIKFINHFLYNEDKKLISDRSTRLLNKILPNGESKTEINEESKLKEDQSVFLSTLFQLQQHLQDLPKYTIDEIITEIGGGIDTSAATISALLLAVAIHPEIQDKLHAELDELFGDDDRLADADDINYLPYLDQVLKETLRRFTVIPLIWRDADEDTKIGSIIYPAGTSIVISISNIHLNPKYYPNPLEFNPENFSPEAESKRPKLAFVPFGIGYRNCVGKNFAQLEMKLITIGLLRAFSFHTDVKMDDIKLTIGFVSVSSIGYEVRIKLRDRAKTKAL